MPVDPRVLQMISDPTSGRLGDIGKTIAVNRQQEIENQAASEKAQSDAEKAALDAQLKRLELTDAAAQTALGYSSNALSWREANPDKSDEEFSSYQAEEWNALSDDQKKIIPPKLQPKEELARGKDRALSYLSARFPDKYITLDKGTRRNALLNGEIVPAIEDERGYLFSPTDGSRMPTATLAPTRQETGEAGAFSGTSSQKGKLQAERTSAQTSLQHHVSGIDYLSKIISSDDFIGGNTAQVASALNSAAAQFRQVTGQDSILDAEGNIDQSQIDPNSKELSRLRKGAILSDSYDAALIEMAYIKAKQVDPSSKITDKDFAFARRMLQSGADKTSLLNILNRERKRSIEKYNEEENIIGSRYEGYKKALWSEDDYKKGLSEPTPKNEGAMTDDELADKMLKDAGLL